MPPLHSRKSRELAGIRRRFEVENARSEPIKVSDGDRKKYGVVKTQNYVKDFDGVINTGELWVVRFLDDSKITVMKGGELRVIGNALNLAVIKEAGAIVEINDMDTSVSITTKEPPIPQARNCPNCGAPLMGGSCSYCGSNFKE
jgi:hypothetical protein